MEWIGFSALLDDNKRFLYNAGVYEDDDDDVSSDPTHLYHSFEYCCCYCSKTNKCRLWKFIGRRMYVQEMGESLDEMAVMMNENKGQVSHKSTQDLKLING